MVLKEQRLQEILIGQGKDIVSKITAFFIEVSLQNWLAPRQGCMADRQHRGKTFHGGQKTEEQ